ncbi:hypothetical protein [Roseivirga seohaensis]|uniref:hypothetical protein n=1 Tax=Roseivirga seohaensis TaxID=1914963 RepID=UPI003BAB76B9
MKVISPGITKAELADMYGVPLKLFNSWLRDIGIDTSKNGRKGRKLTPKQLYIMAKELYLPTDVTIAIKQPHFEVREQTGLDF